MHGEQSHAMNLDAVVHHMSGRLQHINAVLSIQGLLPHHEISNLLSVLLQCLHGLRVTDRYL